jgi:YVTN family beta-propeller protein
MGDRKTGVSGRWPQQWIVSRRAATRRALAAAVGVALLSGGVALALPAPATTSLIASSAVGRAPRTIAVDPVSGHVFVANGADNSVTMLDARTGRVLSTAAVGGDPDQLEVNPRTAHAFVLNAADNSVSVLDTRTGAVLDTLQPGRAPAPVPGRQSGETFVFAGNSGAAAHGVPAPGLLVVHDTSWGPRLQSLAPLALGWDLPEDGPAKRLFVLDMADDSVDLLDAVHGQYLRSIHVGTTPVAVAVDPLTARAFVTSMGPLPPAHPASSVSVLDSHSGRVLHTIAVGPYPALVAVDAPVGRVLVVHSWGRPADAGPGSLGGGTDVLDAHTGQLLATLAVGAVAPESIGQGVLPSLVALDERRGHAFVLERVADDPAAGRVIMLDDREARILRSIAVAPFPVALAVDASAGRLFVLHAFASCHTSASAWAALPASVRRWLPFLASSAPSAGAPQLTCASHGSVSVFDLARL